MRRTTAHRTVALTAGFLASLVLGPATAAPASAHGAPTDPVSRVYACSPGGAHTRTAACRAAVAANGAPFTAWDNLRVANVNGQDRRTIPDGQLCSGGLPAYEGLDLARADWPSTRLTPGGTLRMTYVSTIPHTGTFKLYLTKPGYDPSQPLTWADLAERPFATVKDPALRDGAYRITTKLPTDRTGRQVLYTIWQNSGTPDTYYSCSDVVFPEKAPQAPKVTHSPSSSASRAGTTAAGTPERPTVNASAEGTAAGPTPHSTGATASAGSAAPARSTPVASTTGAGSGPSAPLLAGGAAAVLVLTGGAALVLRLRRR